MYTRLQDILNEAGTPRVLLVGDFMLDRYTYGNADRLSPEAPVMVLNVMEREERLGGAGSVAVDLAALGAEVACVGVVGNDANGTGLVNLLRSLGAVNVDGMVSTGDRPTTCKQRIIGLAQHRHRQQLMRIDDESVAVVPDEIRAQLAARFKGLLNWCDVVCLEDYNKGVLSEALCHEIITAARQRGKRVIVDPAALTDYGRYRQAWLIKPNRRELSLATGMTINGSESWQTAARQLARHHEIETVVVTLDKEGAYLYQLHPHDAEENGAQIPTRPRNVYDVTGAGDMMLAMLGLLTGGRYQGIDPPSIREMVTLANIAGGLEVERFGSVGISRNEINGELMQQRRSKGGKLRSLETLLQELQWYRRQQMKIVFTNGCYDILHPGHLALLNFAKEQGDVLVVALNSDRSVRALKGPQRPIVAAQDRATLLAALEMVDYVIIFDEDTPADVIEKISPDILIKGTDWQGNVVGQDWVEAHGGKVVLMPLQPGHSTTDIIEQVLTRYDRSADKTGTQA